MKISNEQKRELKTAFKNCIRQNYSIEVNQIWQEKIKDLDKETTMSIIREVNSIDERLRSYKNSYHFKTKIRKYCNMHLYTDIEPFEVVKIISDKTIEVRPMIAEITKRPSDFYAGGFAGHYADNYSQEWSFKSNPNAKTTRIRLGKKGWNNGHFVMSDTPRKFYDFNF